MYNSKKRKSYPAERQGGDKCKGIKEIDNNSKQRYK